MDLYVIKDELPQIAYLKIKEDNEYVLLKGYTHRVIRKVLKDTIESASNLLVEKENKIKDKYIRINQNTRKNKVLYGTILHIDGDREYLNSCMEFYKSVNIFAWGLYIKEKEVKNKILNILEDVKPDILVITGHDAYNGLGIKDINNYENSKTYVDVLRKIRTRYKKDDLVIIIGACASHYEALIANGANFASSPGRINIHTYDPAVVASKIATTSCNKVVDYESIIKHIIDGKKAIGGIETKGKMRIIY